MTNTNRFRTVALTLRDYVHGDTYALLAATDAIVALDLPDEPLVVTVVPHNLLVAAALGSPEVMQYVLLEKKINAIKELRALWPYAHASGQGIGLRAAKEAIEDPRVWG
jgi:hypothetical protein